MDKKKQNKEEKVGADGLTKKERRALKIQARETDDNKVELKNLKSTVKDNNKESDKEVVAKSETGVSEKEKRKLEWEKKLAEQKNEQNKDTESLSKTEQKAKRREMQEAQRLAKVKTSEVKNKVETPKLLEKPKPLKTPKKMINTSKVQLLHHLYVTDKPLEIESFCFSNIHPAFVQLGVQYSTKTILGSNARCISLLAALDCLIKDIKTPPQQEFCRYLESVLQKCTEYLQNCRPMAVSMMNALRLFKLQLTHIDTNIPDDDKKQKLSEFVRIYIQDEILTAGRAISLRVFEKISNGDVILIYGYSSLVKTILVDAFLKGKQFKVIVVDSRPILEGREMLRRLTSAGIECTYILINALSYVMSSVSKVLVGAHALLANGYVMSRAGTAQVALVARAYNKSVLLCCETHKFSEKAQTDSLVYNEIGDPDSLLNVDTIDEQSPIRSWKENNKLTPLNLMYDVTPPDLVTAVVTELAILPCTSVPVVLRIKPTEI